MVFTEHTGRGLTGDDTSSMAERWNSKWKNVKEGLSEDMKKSERWQSIKRHMSPPARVLEAGCGLAIWVWFLADQGYDAHGIDFSKSAIEVSLSKWPELKLAVGDLRSMPYEDSFFDGIVSFGAIEHDEEGPEAALAEMYRVLRSSGILYCSVPCHNLSRRLGAAAIKDWAVQNRGIRRLKGINYGPVFWQYQWTPKEYTEILTKAGFEIINMEPLAPCPPEILFGHAGSVRRRIVAHLHRRWPWFMAHMMAGICRKR